MSFATPALRRNMQVTPKLAYQLALGRSSQSQVLLVGGALALGLVLMLVLKRRQ